MRGQITVKIWCLGKNEKKILLISDKDEKEYLISGDLVSEIKHLLKKEKIAFSDIKEFIPLESESFTGYREAITVSNVFNTFAKGSVAENLYSAKYHKDPNINIGV